MKLYVGNLPYTLTEDKVTETFGQYGHVVQVTLINDRMTGKPRGFGFVEMGSKEEGKAAIQALNGKEIEGRALTVNEARPQRSNGNNDRDNRRFG